MPIKIVIDTNVIISAALSPYGNAAKIIYAVAGREDFRLFYSTDILTEYEEVLSREHLNISDRTQANIISTIKKAGKEVEPTTSNIPLPDESDRIFYDTAREVDAILVTGNKKHYPAESFIMTPADFLQFLDKPTIP